MHIKRLEIDGFKSYAQKQVIDGFDEQFNAITGLNGTGKSNILDSICFVLGISNLSHIRAANMNDLVFKQGQAGVTKATVTITFDNSDKENSPLGYSNYKEIVVRRQIVINGRNTYTINGVPHTNSKVSDFFRSVGLNVNNPHFLIMQGRITKVLNMKPPEILGMVEEAAGTKMYDTKRQNSLAIIEKKKSKVAEINDLMEKEILPQIEKLKQDRNDYLEYKKIERDLEHARRRQSAFQYYELMNRMTEHTAALEQKALEMKQCVETIETRKQEMNNAEEQLREAERERASHEKDASYAETERVKTAAEKEKNVAEAARDEVLARLKEARDDVRKKEKRREADEKDKKRKADALAKLQEEDDVEALEKAAEEAVTKARTHLEAVEQGLTTNEQGEAVTLEEQAAGARTELDKLKTEVQKASARLDKLKVEIRDKKKRLGTMSQKETQDERELQAAEAEAKRCQDEMNRLDYSPDIERQLVDNCENLKREKNELERDQKAFFARFSMATYDYQRPGGQFNPADVYGRVCRLFTVKDERYMRAVEVAAGSWLSSVVVRTSEAAKEILKLPQKKRVTFLPLDKIVGHEIDQARMNAARKIVPDARKVLDLVEYEPHLDKAMKQIFGNTLVSETIEEAKQLAYHPSVKKRTVTIDGDDFKPSGVLTGGSRNSEMLILAHMQEFGRREARLKVVVQQLEDIEGRLRRVSEQRDKWERANASLRNATLKLNAIRDAQKFSALQQLREEVTSLEEEESAHNEVIQRASPRLKDLKQMVADFEARQKNSKEFKDAELKAARKRLTDAEKEWKKIQSSSTDARNKINSLREEIVALERQIAGTQHDLEALDKKIEADEKEAATRSEIAAKAKAVADEAVAALEEKKRANRAAEKQLSALREKIAEKRKEMENTELRLKELDIERKNLDAHKREVHAESERVMAANRWLDGVKTLLGKPGSDYEFRGFSVKKSNDEVEALAKRKENIEKHLNTRAMHILSTAEEQVMSLSRKKQQIELDKQKLLDTIETLDRKKENEIQRAYEQVNKDFGNIFTTLLPGTCAKLEAPVGQTIFQGLEVKVGFNGKWKESLSELSGGQRSLVALSLVLAMLKFKPAPIYILDEVDAALDISHTQNIGAMIKKHFTTSQFLIVSLKEGMFNHANVLYRTRFVDGTSQVERCDNRKK